MPTVKGIKETIRRRLPTNATVDKLLKLPSMSKEQADNLLAGVKESIRLDSEYSGKKITCAAAADHFEKKDAFFKKLLPKEDKQKPDQASMAEIKKALANSQDTIDAIQDFKNKIAEHKKKIELMQDNPRVLKDELHRLQAGLLEEMQKQFDEDEKQLESLFAHPCKIQTTDPTQDINDVKTSMVDALKKAHEEQKAAYNKEVGAELKTMHQRTNRAEASALLACIMEKNKNNAEFIEHLRSKRGKKAGVGIGGMITTHNANASDRFADAFSKEDLQVIKKFKTSTGKTLEVSEDGKITMRSSKLGFGITPSDALEQALLARSLGWERVNVVVEHDDPKVARKLAAIQYEAYLKAGYKPDEIVIEMRGKDNKLEKVDLGTLGVGQVDSLLSSDESPSSTTNFKGRLKALPPPAPLAPAAGAGGPPVAQAAAAPLAPPPAGAGGPVAQAAAPPPRR